MKKKTKVCFVAPTAYPLLSKSNIKNIIGPDINQINLAKGLPNKNFEITFITFSDGSEKDEYINNMQIVKIYNPIKEKNPFLKIFKLFKAVKKADADIYFHFGGFLGFITIFSRLIRRKSVYRIASDGILNRKLVKKEIREFSKSKFSFNTIGNLIDIYFSNLILIQNKNQQKLLQKNYGITGFLVKNSINVPVHPIKKNNSPTILWVGSITEVKQPKLFLKLAENIPEAKFIMIGGHLNNETEYNELKNISNKIPNIDFVGLVPYEKIGEYFEEDSILVNTSLFEGFPNAFLQAWSYYCPVVSLNSDPDQIITKLNLGFHSRSFNQLVKDLRILIHDRKLRKEIGLNARKYIENEHDFEKIVLEHITIFNNLKKGSK